MRWKSGKTNRRTNHGDGYSDCWLCGLFDGGGMSDEIRKQAESEASQLYNEIRYDVWISEEVDNLLDEKIDDNEDKIKAKNKIASAIERHLRTIAELSKKASAWDRVKSICCEDGTFLKREHIEEIERQEMK